MQFAITHLDLPVRLIDPLLKTVVYRPGREAEVLECRDKYALAG